MGALQPSADMTGQDIPHARSTLPGLCPVCRMFAHVTRDHSLKDEALFYRFALDEPSKGEKAVSRDGKVLTWAQFLDGILPVDVRPLDGSKQTDLKVGEWLMGRDECGCPMCVSGVCGVCVCRW